MTCPPQQNPHQHDMESTAMASKPPTIMLPYKWPFTGPRGGHLLLTRKTNPAGGTSDVSFTGEARYQGDSFTSEVSVTFAEKDRDPDLWPDGLHVESVQVETPKSLPMGSPLPHDESSYHSEGGGVYGLTHPVEATVKAVYGLVEKNNYHSMQDRSTEGHKTQTVLFKERLIVQPGTDIDFTGTFDITNDGSPNDGDSQSFQRQEPENDRPLTLNYPDTSRFLDDRISSLKEFHTLNRVGDRFTTIVHSKPATEPWLNPVDKETAIVIPVRDVRTAIDNNWDVGQHGAKPSLSNVKSLRVRLGSITPSSANDHHGSELEYDPQTEWFLASAKKFTCESLLEKVRYNDNQFVNMPPLSVGAEIGVTWKVNPSRCPALQRRISRGEELSLSPNDFARERSASAGDGSLLEPRRSGRSSSQGSQP